MPSSARKTYNMLILASQTNQTQKLSVTFFFVRVHLVRARPPAVACREQHICAPQPSCEVVRLRESGHHIGPHRRWSEKTLALALCRMETLSSGPSGMACSPRSWICRTEQGIRSVLESLTGRTITVQCAKTKHRTRRASGEWSRSVKRVMVSYNVQLTRTT